MKEPKARHTFPALRCTMGDWWYYITYMKFSDVAHWIKPTDQIHKSKMLRDMIQRELKPRSNDIATYILEQEERFFNSIVVGVYGGAPQWYPIEVGSNLILGVPDLDEDSRNSIGLLQLQGNENLFAIDGQHRVEAIKQAIKQDPHKDNENLSVIFVAHDRNAVGQERTRRLFTTLNKWAKPVSKGEIIALDEDDAFAVVTRRLVEEFPLLQSESRDDSRFVHFGVQPSLNPNDTKNLTTIRTIYEITSMIYLPIVNNSIQKDRPKLRELKLRRPSDAILTEIYQEATSYWNLLVKYIEGYEDLFKSQPEDEIAGKYRAEHSHFMFRPVGQQAFARATRIMMDRGFEMEKAIVSLSKAPMRLDRAPWLNVLWDPHTQRMKKGVHQQFIEGVLLYLVGQQTRRKNYPLLQLYRKYLGDHKAILPEPVTGTLFTMG